MSRSTIYKVAAICAAGLLVAALGSQAVRAQQAQAKPQPRERPMMGRLAQGLNLTAEQQKKLEAFRKGRQEESQAFRDGMMKDRQEMRQLMQDPAANQAKIDALIDQMSKVRADREKSAIRSRIERDKIFTPEQLEKMKAFRDGFMRGRGPGGRGRSGFFGPERGRFMGRGGMSWRRSHRLWW